MSKKRKWAALVLALGAGAAVIAFSRRAAAGEGPELEPGEGPELEPGADSGGGQLETQPKGVFPEPPGRPPPPLTEAPLPSSPPEATAPDFPDVGRPEVKYDDGRHTKTQLMAGFMYPVKSGDIFLGRNPTKSIAFRGLYSNAYISAQRRGWTMAKSREFAQTIANDPQLRKDYYDLILCASINDALYGTYGYSSGNMPGPQGRAIRLLPQNAKNRHRARVGLPLIRNVRIGNFNQKGDGSGTAIDRSLKEFPWIFIPKLNLDALMLDRKIEPGEGGMYPPFEWSIEVYEDGIGGREFGCRGGEIIL